jgi:hypothetical protein
MLFRTIAGETFGLRMRSTKHLINGVGKIVEIVPPMGGEGRGNRLIISELLFSDAGDGTNA